MVRVLIVEQFETTAEVIRAVLAGTGRLTVVGEAPDGATALGMMSRLQPDVIILDGALGQRDDHSLIRQIKRARPAARLIVLSDHPEPLYREAAVASGADRLILKVHLVKDLLPTIRQVAAEGGPA